MGDFSETWLESQDSGDAAARLVSLTKVEQARSVVADLAGYLSILRLIMM